MFTEIKVTVMFFSVSKNGRKGRKNITEEREVLL